MEERSVINLRCDMRRIALYISIVVLMTVACTEPDGRFEAEGDVSIAYLRSLADERSQRIKSDVWIEGAVVLNDKFGETYKSFVLYDRQAGIEVKVDIENIDAVVPLFAEVRIRCEGLYIGREGERIVLGAEPTAEYVVDRISETELENRLDVIHVYDKYHGMQSIAVEDIGFDDMSRYVRVEGVRVAQEDAALAWCDADAAERPYESSLRHFVSGSDTLTVATLNSCDYATQLIPDDIVTLIGVVDSCDGVVVLRLSNMGSLSPL